MMAGVDNPIAVDDNPIAVDDETLAEAGGGEEGEVNRWMKSLEEAAAGAAVDVVEANDAGPQQKKTMMMQATGDRSPQSAMAALLFVVAYLVFGALVIGITFEACKVRPLRHLSLIHRATASD